MSWAVGFFNSKHVINIFLFPQSASNCFNSTRSLLWLLVIDWLTSSQPYEHMNEYVFRPNILALKKHVTQERAIYLSIWSSFNIFGQQQRYAAQLSVLTWATNVCKQKQQQFLFGFNVLTFEKHDKSYPLSNLIDDKTALYSSSCLVSNKGIKSS